MRRLCVFLASGALLLGVAGSASAGTFTSGTLGLSIGSLPPVTIGDTGVPFTITAGGAMAEPAFEFGPATIPLPRGLFTGVPSISGLTLAGFGNGAKVGTLGVGVTGGLSGSALVNVLGLINLSIPLAQVGLGTMTVMAGAGGIAITVAANNWTAGPQVLTGVTTTTAGTAVVNTVTYVGGVNGVLSGGATVTLVSAFKAVTNVAGNLPGLAIQTLRFNGGAVPEPGTLLLLGSGVVGLALYGRRKLRK